MSMISYDWLKQNKATDKVQQSMSHKATVGCTCSYQGLENDVLLLMSFAEIPNYKNYILI